jgi:hypothetical protein
MARRLQQTAIFDFTPAKPGTPLFCHQEFLEKMEESRSSTVGRRAALLLQRLLVDPRRQYYKPTQGENRGWRRSPLGGNHGSHFYAWWAPRGAVPLQSDPEFEAAPEGAIFLRDIRHHDDHAPLAPQSLDRNYLPLAALDLRQAELAPAPWTSTQRRFAEGKQPIRIVKGFPGSGKTTALWHAAELCGDAILYVTYSPELAALARDYFDKFAPASKRFTVLTYAQLLRRVLGVDMEAQPVPEARIGFVKDISTFSNAVLGPWQNHRAALYDEMHAHLIGAALPVAIGRFEAFPDRRMPARHYRELRAQELGRATAETVVDIAETLRRRDPRPLERRYFQELDLAWNAVQRLRAGGAGALAGFDCIALDEAQDLTPIEALVVVELAAACGAGVRLLVAGDEAQTIRPTDFEWGWFQDLIHARLGAPAEFQLQTNLRSPKRIAALVNRVSNLYREIAKHERPSASGLAEIDENAGDVVVHCAAKPGPELDELLQVFAGREGVALIAVGDEIPTYVPEPVRPSVLTTFEAKGLDFQSVCVLGAGRLVARIFEDAPERLRAHNLDELARRLTIDQLRVALSRPAERLYWIDVNPSQLGLECVQKMLTFSEDDVVWPVVPAVLRKSLEEEALDLEERVRLCESDARQYLDVRPALAWSRARQAVALLGEVAGQFSIMDRATRDSAQLTLCEIAFKLAFRRVSLPVELGSVDLFDEASKSAMTAGKLGLAVLVTHIGWYEKDYSTDKTTQLVRLADSLARHSKDVEPWLLMEIQGRSASWLEAIEELVPQDPAGLAHFLPALYRMFAPADADARSRRVQERAVCAAIRAESYDVALGLLREIPDSDPRLLAECHEGLRDWEAAAAEYLRAGRPDDALRCVRSIPDFDRALELLKDLPDHPARNSLLWLKQMRDLAEQRPAEFGKTVLPAEKKLLESLLETSLGASRKRPAARKTAAKKPVRPRKKAT